MKASSDERLIKLRERAERIVNIDPAGLSELSGEEINKLIHDIQVYQVELEMQNDELRQAQEQLEESRDRFSSLYNLAPVGYLSLDKSGMVLQANNTFTEMLGIERSAVIDKPFANFIDPRDRDVFHSRYKSFFKAPEGKSMSVRLVKRESGTMHVKLEGKSADISHGPLQSRQPGEPSLLVTVTDVTELVRAHSEKEAALAKAEQRARLNEALLASSKEVLENDDFNVTARRIFDACCGLIGAKSGYVAMLSADGSENEVLFLEAGGLPCSVDPELPMPIRGLRAEAYRSCSSAYDNDFSNSKWMDFMPEGHVGLKNVMFTPLCLRGKAVGLIGMANKDTDFNDKDARLAEAFADLAATALKNSRNIEALRDREGKITSIFEGSAIGMGMFEMDGRPIALNTVLMDLFGVSDPALLDGGIPGIPLPGQIRDEVEFYSKSAAGGRERFQFDKLLCSLGGREFWGRVIVSAGAGAEEEEGAYFVVTIEDITELRKMQDEFDRSRKLESVGVLAGGIAHDFNNIMTGVFGNIELAKLSCVPGDEIHPLLEEAGKATGRAISLTQQLLTFSRGGAPVKKTASIEDIVRDSAAFSLRGSNVICRFSFAEGLRPVEVDPGQIAQVVNNLIINADQAMPEGGRIDVRARNLSVGEHEGMPVAPGEYVNIDVADEGAGIAPETLPRIFDPYFTTKQKGSGLGLATAYSVVKKHGGHISAESEVGRGTTFTVLLPASLERAEDPAGPEPERGAAPAAPSRAPGKGRVLIMDDEKIVRDVAGKMLRHLGYDIAAVEDGQKALDLYASALEAGKPFDVVVMDLTIPGGMGGKEAVAKLLEFDPKARAIVASGYSNDPVMSEYKDHGFKNVIRKPFIIDQIGKAITDTLAE